MTSMNKKSNLQITFLDFDDTRNPLLGGGQAKTTLEIGKRLAENGHQITVVCSRYPGSRDRREAGITYKHIGVGTGNIRLNNALYILTLPFYVRKSKADLIVECFTAPVSTMLTPLFTKTPVVGLSTCFDADRFTKQYHLPFNLIEKYGAKAYKYFLAYTPYHEKKMKKLNQKVVSKNIPEGVEKIFLQIKRKNPKHILFIGRYDFNQKGLDLLLLAYAQESKKIKYPLLIVGVGPDKNKIVNLVDELNLKNKVIISGPIYGKEKMKLLSESAFVVVPSRDETFSLVTLEALASGSPVVIFRIGGLSWVAEHVALKAKPFSVNEYSKLLLKLNNESLRKKMGSDARSFARKFTWEKITNEFETFFFEVLKREREASHAK